MRERERAGPSGPCTDRTAYYADQMKVSNLERFVSELHIARALISSQSHCQILPDWLSGTRLSSKRQEDFV
jgi:hypothetical protein